MANEGYEKDWQSPEFGPPWMHGPWGNALWRSLGKTIDAQNDLMRLARKVSMPERAAEMGASDALDRIGDDRLLPRGGTAPTLSDESDAAYASRLKAAWTAWGQDHDSGGGAGSAKSILQQIAVAGFPVEPTSPNYTTTGAFLVNHVGYFYQLRGGELVMPFTAGACENRQKKDGTVPGAGDKLIGWTLDARDQFYSRWMLVFAQDVPSLTNASGNVPKSRLNAICRRWKSGSAIYSGCSVVPQGNGAKVIGFPLSTTFGQSGLVFGANGARFIDPE
jgi:hypothetical protein